MQYGLAYAHTGAASSVVFFMKGPAAKEDSYLPQQRQGGPLLIHWLAAGSRLEHWHSALCLKVVEPCLKHAIVHSRLRTQHVIRLCRIKRSLSCVARSACLLAIVAQHSTHALQVTCQIRSWASQTSKAVYVIQQQALHGNAAGCC